MKTPDEVAHEAQTTVRNYLLNLVKRENERPDFASMCAGTIVGALAAIVETAVVLKGAPFEPEVLKETMRATVAKIIDDNAATFAKLAAKIGP